MAVMFPRLAGTLLLALCLSSSPAFAVDLKDAAGRTVTVSDASRIVSVGGAVTEILYALGLDKQIVGVDTTSLYPDDALRTKPNVGYMRQLSTEGVLGLRPSLILSIEGAGPKEAVNILQSSGIPIVTVPDHYSGDGIVEKIGIIAQAAGQEARGRCLAGRVRADLDALSRLRPGIDKPKRVMFVISLINGRAMVAGRKTAADGIIALAGGENAIADYDGYKPVSDEAIIAARPDIILTMERGADSMTPERVFGMAAFAATPAAKDRQLVTMDGLYLLGFGPRTASAARDLAVALYPGKAFGKLPSEQTAESCPN